MMKDVKFEELVTKFIADSEYQYVLDFEKNFNIFDICHFGEERSAAFLGWLLNPTEGHGLGDRFLKEFLMANFETYEKYGLLPEGERKQRFQRLSESGFFKEISKYAIATGTFQNVSVFQDVYFNEGTPNLIVLMHDQKVAVVIESRFTDEFTEGESGIDYGKIASLPAGYEVLYTYIDRDLTPERERRVNTNWLCMDFSFIEGFLENVIDRGIVPPKVNMYLKDYMVYLTGDYSESKMFEKKQRAFERVYRTNQELVFYMKEYRFEGKRLVDLTPTEKFFAKAKGMSKEIEFFLGHETILTELIEYSDFAWIKTQLESKIGSEFDFDTNVGHDYVSIYNTSWNQFLMTSMTDDWSAWGLDLYYYRRGEIQEILFNVNPTFLEDKFFETFYEDFKALPMVKELKEDTKRSKIFLIENVNGVSEEVVSEKLVEYFRELSKFFATRSFARKAA